MTPEFSLHILFILCFLFILLFLPFFSNFYHFSRISVNFCKFILNLLFFKLLLFVVRFHVCFALLLRFFPNLFSHFRWKWKKVSLKESKKSVPTECCNVLTHAHHTTETSNSSHKTVLCRNQSNINRMRCEKAFCEQTIDKDKEHSTVRAWKREREMALDRESPIIVKTQNNQNKRENWRENHFKSRLMRFF